MEVAVVGLWHLGAVTAACLASAGHRVAAWDPDPDVVARFAAGDPPIFEPGLRELMRTGLDDGSLRAEAERADVLRGARVVWVTFDTPVDADDRADVDAVLAEVRGLYAHLEPGVVLLISSQLPVGSAARVQAEAPDSVHVACSPENLRLGKAIEVFTQPDRVVVGVDSEEARAVVAELLAPITDRIEWMSVASAEMAKHALNAFLATSVSFINEVASLCERVGADAKEVERALKTEQRIGRKAYLGPGGAFAGGTLARDVRFLTEIGEREGRPTPLLQGVWASNDAHKGWARRALGAALAPAQALPSDGALRGRTVAVWGLTYKPGTDTLRRSSSVELCRDLLAAGAAVRAHDPAVTELPPELAEVELGADPLAAVQGADALVVATEWPEYREVAASGVVAALDGDLVVDANGFLSATLGAEAALRHVTVGRA